MEQEFKPILVLRSSEPSDSGSRSYGVSVYSDGTALCECVAFAINRNRGDLDYRCKHITRVMARQDVSQKIAAVRVEQKRASRRNPQPDPEPYTGRRAKTIDL